MDFRSEKIKLGLLEKRLVSDPWFISEKSLIFDQRIAWNKKISQKNFKILINPKGPPF